MSNEIQKLNPAAIRAITLRTLLKQATDKLGEDWGATPPLPDTIGTTYMEYSMYVGFEFDPHSDLGLAIANQLEEMGLELNQTADQEGGFLTYRLNTGVV